MFDAKKLGKYIAASRSIAGLTQSELAARVGTSRQTIMRAENGKCDGIAFQTMLDILEEVGWEISLHKGIFCKPVKAPASIFAKTDETDAPKWWEDIDPS